jgi:ElaB/YqjD/DUF883 family membrane-anchored ribosome-binding protein
MNPSTESPPMSYSPGSQSTSGGSANGIAGTATNALSQLPQRAREAAQQTRDLVQEKYEQVRSSAGQGLAAGETYVRDHPLPTVLGALALGTLVGFAIGMSRREESLRERLTEDPLNVIREAVIAALSPAADRIHDSYDHARDAAAKAVHSAQRNASGYADSWARSLRRAGSNLKFW